MLSLSNYFTPIILCTSIWINLCLSYFSSLGETASISTKHGKFSDIFQCESTKYIANKQSIECSRWLMEIASEIGADIPLSIVSVVIVSHNEKHKILINTINSLLMNTSHTLLKEVIVVDDYSQPPIDLRLETSKVQVNTFLFTRDSFQDTVFIRFCRYLSSAISLDKDLFGLV